MQPNMNPQEKPQKPQMPQQADLSAILGQNYGQLAGDFMNYQKQREEELRKQMEQYQQQKPQDTGMTGSDVGTGLMSAILTGIAGAALGSGKRNAGSKIGMAALQAGLQGMQQGGQQRAAANQAAQQQRQLTQKQLDELYKTKGDWMSKFADTRTSAYKEKEKAELGKRQEQFGVNKWVAEQEEKRMAKEEAKTKAGKITEGQSKKAGFATRMETSNKVIDDVMKNVDIGSVNYAMQDMLPNVLKSEEMQMLRTAKEDFILAVLRDESGAAIGKDEFKKYDPVYFPQWGDKPRTIELKRQLREQQMAAAAAGAGEAARQAMAEQHANFIQQAAKGELPQADENNLQLMDDSLLQKRLAELKGQGAQ